MASRSAILADVTAARLLEERLRQSQKIEAVGQLAGGIAHDFNNLLVVITAYGELALERAGDDTKPREDSEQGLIEVESEPGEGTEFTLLLPAVNAPTVSTAPAADKDTASECFETILLIEDDDGVREIARRVLAQAGYTVIEAGYGSEALDVAADHPEIDLVLSDVVMPGLSGPEVVQRLRATRPEIVPLFMSGYAPESAGPLGGAELIHKPFTGAELLAAVRKAFDSDAAE